MEITAKKVIGIEGIGYFEKAGEEWNGLQQWSMIDSERQEYFISINSNKFGIFMLDSFFGEAQYGDETFKIILCSNMLAKKFKEDKDNKCIKEQ